MRGVIWQRAEWRVQFRVQPAWAEPRGGGAQFWGGVWAGVALGAWPLRPCAPCRPAAAVAGLLQQRVYALHLRHYNDALLIHDTVRAVDALAALQDFYDRERDTKTQILHAERWLLRLFDGEARREEGVQNGTSGQRPARVIQVAGLKRGAG